MTLDTAVARGEVLGDTLKRGGAAKVSDLGWGKGMLWRCELPRGKTPSFHPHPVSSASHGKRLELPKGGGCILTPSHFSLQVEGNSCWMYSFVSSSQLPRLPLAPIGGRCNVCGWEWARRSRGQPGF